MTPLSGPTDRISSQRMLYRASASTITFVLFPSIFMVSKWHFAAFGTSPVRLSISSRMPSLSCSIAGVQVNGIASSGNTIMVSSVVRPKRHGCSYRTIFPCRRRVTRPDGRSPEALPVHPHRGTLRHQLGGGGVTCAPESPATSWRGDAGLIHRAPLIKAGWLTAGTQWTGSASVVNWVSLAAGPVYRMHEQKNWKVSNG